MGRLLKVKVIVYDNWEKCLDDFLLEKAAEGLGDRTLKDYRWHVGHFFSGFPDCWQEYEKLKKSTMAYFAQARTLSPATNNIRRKYLKSFFGWCVRQGVFPHNPTDNIPLRREDPRVRPLDEAKLRLLLDAPCKNTFPGIRDYAMLCLSLDTGIRPKEMISLLIDDLDLRSFEIRVRAEISKTGISRTLPISSITGDALRKLLSITPKEWNNKTIFYTCEGLPMTTNAWRLSLDRYSSKLGFKVSGYDLRHAFAVLYLRNGGHAFGLQRTLGHTSMEMTKRYVEMTDQDMKMQHHNASPLLKLAPKKKRLRKI